MEKTVRNILFDYSLVSSLPHAKHLTSENNKTILFIDSTGSTGFIDSTGSTGFIDSTGSTGSTLYRIYSLIQGSIDSTGSIGFIDSTGSTGSTGSTDSTGAIDLYRDL